MKCLITGCAGFIGSHLCDRLLQDGHHVIGVDNFLTGRRQNIAHLADNTQFTFIEHDVSAPLTITENLEIVFHFASPASPPKYQQFPIETLQVNTQGTYHLLQKARDWGARFVFASSSEIYGDPKQHPQREEYWGNVNPVGPRSCYDEGKRCGEALCMAFFRQYAMDVRMVRIFNTYGPRMDADDGRVITNFIKQIRYDTALTIYGDGNQTRSFCYVSDLVEGIVKLAFAHNIQDRVFNIGNPAEISVVKLAKLLQEHAGTHLPLVHKRLPQDDPRRRKPDISRAEKQLEWKPTVSVAQGLDQTFAHFT